MRLVEETKKNKSTLIYKIMMIFILGGAITGFSISRSSGLTIDTSSIKSVKSSIETIKKSLPEEKRKRFLNAMGAISAEVTDKFKQKAFASLILTPSTFDKEEIAFKVFKEICKRLKDKTVDQIIEEGEPLFNKREEFREKMREINIESIENDIERIETRNKKIKDSNEILSKLKVIKSRFYSKSIYDYDHLVDLTIKNNTKHAISRVFFNGVVSSKDRDVPWDKDRFVYSIPGGIEPGEEISKTIKLYGFYQAPANVFGKIFKLTVTRIDNKNGDPIASLSRSNYDKSELIELKKKLSVLSKHS